MKFGLLDQSIKPRETLEAFYQRKKIVTGKEAINLNIETINFPAYPKQAKQFLTPIVFRVVAKINQEVLRSSASLLKERRKVLIENDTDLESIDELSVNSQLSTLVNRGRKRDIGSKGEGSCLGHVIQRLEELGIIYSYEREAGLGYMVQA